MKSHELITFILYLVIIITSLILVIIYIGNKSLHYYPFYCNLILLLIILLNNILRILIQKDKLLFYKEMKTNEYICYGQAFILSFLDKLMLSTLTMNSLLIFCGTTKKNIYKTYEKYIFYSFLCISIIISIILPSIYLFKSNLIESNENKNFCYPIINGYRKIIDFSFISFILCFNFYLLLNILFYLSEKMKIKFYGEKNTINYNNAFAIIIFMFLINGFFYLIILLKINNKLFFNEKYFDLCYSSISLIIEIFYSINKRVAKTFLFVITCGKKKYINDKSTKEKDTDTRATLTGSEGMLSDISLSI